MDWGWLKASPSYAVTALTTSVASVGEKCCKGLGGCSLELNPSGHERQGSKHNKSISNIHSLKNNDGDGSSGALPRRHAGGHFWWVILARDNITWLGLLSVAISSCKPAQRVLARKQEWSSSTSSWWSEMQFSLGEQLLWWEQMLFSLIWMGHIVV